MCYAPQKLYSFKQTFRFTNSFVSKFILFLIISFYFVIEKSNIVSRFHLFYKSTDEPTKL